MRSWHLVVVLCASCLPGFAAEVSLSDPFDGSGRLTWVAVQGDWQSGTGAYHIQGSGQSYVSDAVFGDVEVEADWRITHPGAIVADWVGVILGGDSSGARQGCLVYLRYSGEVEVFHGGRILALKQTGLAPKLKAGESVHLVATAKGSRVSASVDGVPYLDCDAPDSQPGNVGLATYDVTADCTDFRARGQALGNTISGEVLLSPGAQPVAGARVDIYDSMDGYNSLVTRETVTDARGRFTFQDLPAGEKAYWLRAGQPGFGGTTAWFVSVGNAKPTAVELWLVPPPRHDIWIDSASVSANRGFRRVEDPQCYGGSRLEVKATRPSSQHPEWSARFEFRVEQEADYVPYFAAGLYPEPHYWSDYWWSIDGRGPFQASRTLAIEGPRYGDRATCTWAAGPPPSTSRPASMSCD
jgi:hypothetical protein